MGAIWRKWSRVAAEGHCYLSYDRKLRHHRFLALHAHRHRELPKNGSGKGKADGRHCREGRMETQVSFHPAGGAAGPATPALSCNRSRDRRSSPPTELNTDKGVHLAAAWTTPTHLNESSMGLTQIHVERKFRTKDRTNHRLRMV